MGKGKKIESEELELKIWRQAIEMTHQAKAPHLGSILSIADIVDVWRWQHKRIIKSIR
jgi:hypothetical protein